jgi:hypothetical protein
MVAHVIVEIALAGKTGAGRPGDLQFLGRLDRLPRLVGDDADPVLLHDDLTLPGIPLTELSSTLTSVAPIAGGRTILRYTIRGRALPVRELEAR